MWLQIFVVATIVCFALLIGSARILKRFPSLTGVFALFLLTISIVYLDIISPNSAIFPRDADE
jgi:energy-coupling factor transporter transmembrane protein EcfT